MFREITDTQIPIISTTFAFYMARTDTMHHCSNCFNPYEGRHKHFIQLQTYNWRIRTN